MLYGSGLTHRLLRYAAWSVVVGLLILVVPPIAWLLNLCRTTPWVGSVGSEWALKERGGISDPGCDDLLWTWELGEIDGRFGTVWLATQRRHFGSIVPPRLP